MTLIARYRRTAVVLQVAIQFLCYAGVAAFFWFMAFVVGPEFSNPPIAPMWGLIFFWQFIALLGVSAFFSLKLLVGVLSDPDYPAMRITDGRFIFVSPVFLSIPMAHIEKASADSSLILHLGSGRRRKIPRHALRENISDIASRLNDRLG